jgi:hypothetical protein
MGTSSSWARPMMGAGIFIMRKMINFAILGQRHGAADVLSRPSPIPLTLACWPLPPCFATIVTIAAPSLAEDKLARASRRSPRSARNCANEPRGAREGKAARTKTNAFAKTFVDKLNLQRRWKIRYVDKKLNQAGLRGPRPETHVLLLPRRAADRLRWALAYIFFINDTALSFR